MLLFHSRLPVKPYDVNPEGMSSLASESFRMLLTTLIVVLHAAFGQLPPRKKEQRMPIIIDITPIKCCWSYV